jgi:hypothetical protein
MGRFLVERYLSAASAGSLDADAAQLNCSGEIGVRLLMTIYCPGDETCFHLFEAGSAAHVQRAGATAGIELDRIVSALQIGEGIEPDGRSA